MVFNMPESEWKMYTGRGLKYYSRFTVQVYLDFSGYSDMGGWIMKMFGFQFKENFIYPFICQINERIFWTDGTSLFHHGLKTMYIFH